MLTFQFALAQQATGQREVARPQHLLERVGRAVAVDAKRVRARHEKASCRSARRKAIVAPTLCPPVFLKELVLIIKFFRPPPSSHPRMTGFSLQFVSLSPILSFA